MRTFLAELKRRNVYRVAAAYLIVAWLLTQVAATLLPIFDAPQWTLRLVVVLLALGFVVAVVLAWLLELTPQGLRLTAEPRAASTPAQRPAGRRMDIAIVSLLLVALAYFVATHDWREALGGDAPAANAAPAAAKSVAVLPFVNLSAAPDSEYFSDGLADTIIHVLSQVPDLKVVARTSSFRFREGNHDVRDIGRQLGASAILEGSVQRSGERLRVIAQLVRASDGTHYWSRTFERSREDVFAIQDDIAREVLAALEVSLLGRPARRLAKSPTTNLEAYDAYLRARQSMARRTSASVLEARAHLERAIELDPNYALAHATLAEVLVLLSQYGGLDERTAAKLATAAAERALALDPGAGEPHAALGLIAFQRLELTKAEEALRKAIERSPSYATSYGHYSNVMNALGRIEEGVAAARRAVELDPLAPLGYIRLGYAYQRLGRREDPLHAFLRAIEVDREFAVAYMEVGEHHRSITGRLDEAVRWHRRAIAIDPSNPALHARLALTLFDLGDFQSARAQAARAFELNPTYDATVFARISVGIIGGDCAAVRPIVERRLLEGRREAVLLATLASCRIERVGERGVLDFLAATYPELTAPKPKVRTDNSRSAIEVARVLALHGRREQAQRLARAAIPIVAADLYPGASGRSYWEAIAWSLTGDAEGTLDAIRRAVDAGVRAGVVRLYVTESFDWLRKDPRFVAILARLDAEARQMRESLARSPDLAEDALETALLAARR